MLWIDNTDAAHALDDQVQLSVSRSALREASMLIFALPLLCMIATVAIAAAFGLSEETLFIFVGFGFLVGTSAAIAVGLRLDWSTRFNLQIVADPDLVEPQRGDSVRA